MKKSKPPVAKVVSSSAKVEEKKVGGEKKVVCSEGKKAGVRSCAISLMDICRLDTPLVKRIPNSQRAAFAENGEAFWTKQPLVAR